MYYDKQIETAETPLELGQFLDLEMEQYSIGSCGIAIDPAALTLAIRSAIGICRDSPHLDFPDVPSDIVGLQMWCVKAQKIYDGNAEPEKPAEAETTETLEPKTKGRYPKMGSGTEPTERLMIIKIICCWYKIGKRKIYRYLEDGQLTCWPDKKGITRIDTQELKTYAILRDLAERKIELAK